MLVFFKVLNRLQHFISNIDVTENITYANATHVNSTHANTTYGNETFANITETTIFLNWDKLYFI